MIEIGVIEAILRDCNRTYFFYFFSFILYTFYIYTTSLISFFVEDFWLNVLVTWYSFTCCWYSCIFHCVVVCLNYFIYYCLVRFCVLCHSTNFVSWFIHLISIWRIDVMKSFSINQFHFSLFKWISFRWNSIK